jgi:hypothetical protein
VAQREAQAGVTSQAAGGHLTIAFEEAREIVTAALRDGRPVVRRGAVRALNVFGRSASAFIPLLERMSVEDPDPGVRESSQLAIEAIRRELGGAA